MKTLLTITTFVIATIIISCSKTTESVKTENVHVDSAWVYVNTCDSIKHDNITYRACLDSVVSDSRCPIGANCVWQGLAVARFKLYFSNKVYSLSLATTTFANHKKDTTIQGYKISLDSLLPHPAINNIYPYSAYKAKIVISQ